MRIGAAGSEARRDSAQRLLENRPVGPKLHCLLPKGHRTRLLRVGDGSLPYKRQPVVLFHDNRIKFVKNGSEVSKRIDSCSYEELAGIPLQRERLPLLEDILEIAKAEYDKNVADKAQKRICLHETDT